jgi:NAD(P)-dependent dehydrogenase (short-subunit alcohol dehydrogenase family)
MDAVITGASTGIGRACALRLDREGWRVFAGVRREQDAESLRSEAGSRLTPLIIDVTNEATIAKAAAQVAEATGSTGLHGLLNNAGIGVGGPIEFVELDDWRRQLEVNVIGQIAVTKAFLPQIRAAKGRIVFTGSVGGRNSTPFLSPYTASKHAIEAIADSLRGELRKFGIWVAVIEPGSIATPIWDKAKTDLESAVASLTPDARALYGDDVEKFGEFFQRIGAKGIPPEVVADKVWHAFTAKRPRARYLIGTDAKAQIAIKTILPERALDAALSRLIGLGK